MQQERIDARPQRSQANRSPLSAVAFAFVFGFGALFAAEGSAADRAKPLAAGQSCESSKARPRCAAAPTRQHPAKWKDLAAHSTLAPDDVLRYRRIFDLQRAGDITGADREIAKLNDATLLGHVLYERYIERKDYQASYAELHEWLERYADQPGATEIYALALKRKPRKESGPRRPVVASSRESGEGWDGLNVDGEVAARHSSDAKVSALFTEASSALKADAPEKALALVDSPEIKGPLHRVDRDRLRSAVAAYWFYAGEDRRAFELAAASAARSGEQAPRARWIAGMAAWRLGMLDQAARHFEALALSRRTSSWTASAAAYWAARAHLRNRSPQKVTIWLEQAARFPYTFYGMVARRTLGLDLEFQWDLPELSHEHQQAIAAYPAGVRALALIAAGQKERAEQELARIDPKGDAVLTQALLAVAEHGGMPALTIKIANAFRDQDGGPFDAGLYPIPPWKPKGGFSVDRALVYALMRQESRFNPQARSSAGAAGLMQLMPDTAAQMKGARRLTDGGRKDLFDPSVNVDLGHRYLRTLLGDPDVGGNLFLLVTAYNGGPANAARWRKSINDGGDPLLFIESIPFGETRAFIERVMANYWMYRTRLGLPTRSLSAIASGEWPLYDRPEDPMFQIVRYEPTR